MGPKSFSLEKDNEFPLHLYGTECAAPPPPSIPHPPPLPPHPCICSPYLILSDGTSLHNLTFYASLFKYLRQRQLCDNLCSHSGSHSGESHDGLMLCCHCLEWNLAIYSNVDGPRGYHTQWNRKEKTNICYLHVEPKEYNWWKQKGRLTDLENQLMVSSGERWGGNVRVGSGRYKLLGVR